MKSVVFTGRDTVRYDDLPDPTPRSDEVVIEVKASGICHTDYEVLKANYGTANFPVVPGHEYAGVVVEVGKGVSTFAVGDRVVVDPNLECGSCRACQRGWAHLCRSLGAYGVTANGGFARYGVVHASNIHGIGELSFSRAALAEPMGCVLNGTAAVMEPWMENALIFGAGPMGLLMGLALRAQGIPDVAFCDLSDSRLDLAASFGFAALPRESAALHARRHDVDLVVEATGATAVAASLPDYLVNGGKGLFFGVCPSDARIEVAPFEIFRRQLTLAGSHSLNHNIPMALEIISGLGPDIERLVSHRLPLEEISRILDTAPPEDSLKVQSVTD